MLFDVDAALAEILKSSRSDAIPASPAIPAPFRTPNSTNSREGSSEIPSRQTRAIGAASTPLLATENAEIIILEAIRAGRKTPGSVASATRLGATRTYQELDRMVGADMVSMAVDGTYSPAPDGTK